VNNLKKFKQTVLDSKTILIIQAENPDGDSLGSSLALENIFLKLDKDTKMHCAVNMPDYLKHFEGWDRVETVVDSKFDMAIIVDASRSSLLEKTIQTLSGPLSKSKIFVLDHHKTESDLPFDVSLVVDIDAVATGEMIYDLAIEFGWEIDSTTANMLASSILYDSLGLMTPSTTAKSIKTVSELVELGANLPQLDENRREMMKRDQDITKYKGELLQRIDYALDGKVAHLHIPWEEIEEYSSRYNPPMLVLEDMRLTKGVLIAIAFKTYPDGKLTAKIKSNFGYPVARALAEHFGGGGHDYAAGFKLPKGNLAETLKKCVKFLSKEDGFESI